MEVTFDGEGGRRRNKAAFRLNRLAGLRNKRLWIRARLTHSWR